MPPAKKLPNRSTNFGKLSIRTGRFGTPRCVITLNAPTEVAAPTIAGAPDPSTSTILRPMLVAISLPSSDRGSAPARRLSPRVVLGPRRARGGDGLAVQAAHHQVAAPLEH